MQAWWTSQFGGLDPSYNRVLYPISSSNVLSGRTSSVTRQLSIVDTPTRILSPKPRPAKPRCLSLNIEQPPPPLPLLLVVLLLHLEKRKSHNPNPRPKSEIPSHFNEYTQLVPQNPYLDNVANQSAPNGTSDTQLTKQDPLGIINCIPEHAHSNTQSHPRHSPYGKRQPQLEKTQSSLLFTESPHSEEYKLHQRKRSEYILSKSVLNFFDGLSDDEKSPSTAAGATGASAASRQCNLCHSPLGSSKTCTARGNTYHKDCIQCYDCGKPCLKKFFRYKIEVPVTLPSHASSPLAPARAKKSKGRNHSMYSPASLDFKFPNSQESGECSAKIYESNDNDDNISITAPLRINRSKTQSLRHTTTTTTSSSSSSSSSFSSGNDDISYPSSPNDSTFDHHGLSAVTSHTSHTSIESSSEVHAHKYDQAHSHTHNQNQNHQTKQPRPLPQTPSPANNTKNITYTTVTKEVVLCEYDMFNRLNMICQICDTAIRDRTYIDLGESSQNSNNKIHQRHMECAICHKRPSNNTDNGKENEDEKFYLHKKHMYCHRHYLQYFVNLRCELCDLDLSKESNFKMVEMPQSGEIVYYDAKCFKELLSGA